MLNIQQQIMDFNTARDWLQYHTPQALAMKIAVESAELLQCFEWDNRIHPLDVTHARQELADVLICCLSMATSMNLDAEQIILEKLALNAIKYPPVTRRPAAMPGDE